MKKDGNYRKTTVLVLLGIAVGALLVSPAGAHVGGTISHLWDAPGHLKARVSTFGDARWSAKAHNHDASYASTSHTHPGLLLTVLEGNVTATSASSGYLNIVSNYAASVDAHAVMFTRCSANGNAASQRLAIRSALRTPTDTGSVTVGDMFYMFSDTPAANVSVYNGNFDSFQLTGGHTYDFGVDFGSAPPPGGTSADYCSQIVQIFSR